MGNVVLEAIRLNQSAPVELFVFDASRIGGGIERFCGQLNGLGGGVVWQGVVYTPIPVRATGFESGSGGAFPRPRIKVSNVNTAYGSLGQVAARHDGFRGATLRRIRTYARFLDGANFAGGNDQADPTAHWDPENWMVERVIDKSPETIEWELANPYDVMGAKIPARTIEDNWCQWGYRSSDCTYTGPAVAKRDDTPTTDMALDACSGRRSGCRARFGHGVLPASFFPGVGKVRQL